MPHPAIICLTNRQEFYETLLPRIPEPGFRERLLEAVHPISAPDSLREIVQSLPDSTDAQEALADLALDDLLKKPAHGRNLGRVTISIREVLKNAQEIERGGFILFQTLAKQELKHSTLFEETTQQHLTALNRLLKLEDSLRYHRYRLVAAI